jgi:predicted dehydrogenase
MKSVKVKLGIIGTGIAAKDLHLPPLMNLKDKFEITCVCNHTEKKAKEFSALVGNVPYFLDYRDLLARKDVDAVDILLPIELNCRVTLDSLEAGKHVIVEKPLAAGLEDAQTMRSFPNRFSSVMMVAENYRYNPVFRRVKELIGEGEIGEPYSVFWDQFTVTDLDNKYAQTAWRINHKYPGGFVMDAGIHNIATLRDLFGEVKAGIAFNRSVNPEIGRMDSMSFQFVFASGVNGVFNMYFSAQGLNRNQLLILGSKGSLAVEENRIVLKRQNKRDSEEAVRTDRGYQGQFEDFYECIVNHKRPVSTFEEAFKDFRTMLTALNSAAEWERLGFPA